MEKNRCEEKRLTTQKCEITLKIINKPSKKRKMPI